MKHWILLLSVSMMSAAIFLISLTNNQDNLDKPSIELHARKGVTKDRVVSLRTNSKKRSLASIPSSPLKEEVVYLGLKKEDLVNFPISNKVSNKWEITFLTNLEKSLVNILPNSLKLKRKRSLIKKENKSSRRLEHVIVRYQSPSGNPFTFEALIDSETGTMVQSWNKTRYEKRLPIALDGTNRMMRKTQ